MQRMTYATLMKKAHDGILDIKAEGCTCVEVVFYNGRRRTIEITDMAVRKTYVLQTIGYRGATPQDAFLFTAANDTEAARKVGSWCRYHGMQYPADAVFAPATEKHALYEIHNDWVNHG